VESPAGLLQDPLVPVLVAEVVVPVRTVTRDSGRVGRRERGVGRRLAPARDLALEVSMGEDEGVALVRMGVPALGHEDDRSEVHVATPEAGEALAPEPDVLHVLRVRRRRQWRKDVVEGEGDRRAGPRIDLDANRGRDQVARCERPLLPFPPIRRQLEDPAVRAPEGLVAVEDRLHLDRTRRQRGEAADWIAEDVPLEGRRPAGREVTDVDAEDLGGAVHVGHVLAGLALLVGVEDDEKAARHRTIDDARLKPHLEAQRAGLRGRGCPRGAGGATEESDGRGDERAKHGTTLDHEAVAVAIDVRRSAPAVAFRSSAFPRAWPPAWPERPSGRGSGNRTAPDPAP